MAVYAIGDIQGCYDELLALLVDIQFDRDQDTLWFCGDLVNRGRQSLDTLRFVRSLGDRAITVLGNHDLHLLAVHAGVKKDKKDSLSEVLEADDVDELIDWLRRQPLLHHNASLGYTLIHAGLPPQWNLKQAILCARELQTVLRGDNYRDFLKVMYGDRPRRWRSELTGWDRLRFICNAFTRLRYCHADGRLALDEKAEPGRQAADHIPWFEMAERASTEMNIIFGHWSTLGSYHVPGIYALDSGCVWGGQLTALRLDIAEPRFHSIHCPGAQNPLDYL
jgi:bis(5'-nucleosyl)-tetraphosphatase (symmetrical)